MQIIPDRWAEVEQKPLHAGSHQPDGQWCAMEAAAYVAGEEWTDHPACVSPVIAAFLRNWNDNLDDDDRQRLKPYILKAISTRTSQADEETRAWLAIDWLVRVQAPAWLDQAGLKDRATELRNLPPLTSAEIATAVQSVLDAARNDAAAARDAAWDAAGDAARDAARAALQPTVTQLQESAFELLDRMCAVGRAWT